MKSLRIVGISCTLLSAVSCGGSVGSQSAAKAEMDQDNDVLQRYGLSTLPTYEELRSQVSVMLRDENGGEKVPWVSSYWATIDKGLARRWGVVNSFDEANQDPRGDFRLGAFFETSRNAILNADSVISLNLSPAEKFDIAHRMKKGFAIDETAVNVPELTAIDQQQESFSFSGLDMNAVIATKRGWVSDYLKAFAEESAATAERSPMTFESLDLWLRSAADSELQFPGTDGPGNDWSWYGICHGWAAAALMSDEPRHAVHVEIPVEGAEPKSLFFTESDIRSLLSRAWSDDSDEGKFMLGRRCNENVENPEQGVPANAEGRAISGSLKYELQDGSFRNSPFTIVQDYPRTDAEHALYRIILEREWSEEGPRFGYLIQRGFEEPEYALSFDEKSAFAAIEDPEAQAELREVSDVFLSGCWDVNPASFHALLVKNIGEKNLGIIMDRSQSGQVWNQPVARADFAIGELQRVEEMGVADVGRYYRAPGTAYLAQVEAEVFWGQEPSLLPLTYAEGGVDFDRENYVSSRYSYTLEFDRDQRLIGGEWGNFENLSLPRDNPDFIYGYKRRTEPDHSGITTYIREAYEQIIRKLHHCSLGEATGRLTLTETVGETVQQRIIDYATCRI